MRMPHGALNDIHSVEDAARYWELRHEALAAERVAVETHWTHAHPANVSVLRGASRLDVDAEVHSWLREHADEQAANEPQAHDEAEALER